MTTRRAASIRPGQFRHLIRVASVTGRMPERDVMLLYLTTTGIRVTELALLEVGDVLYPSGVIRPEVYLRAEITKGCRARNIYLTQPKCLASIEQWIALRLRRGWGISSEVEYRGLRPDSRLVMTHKGQAFELAFKRRELESGPEVYRACDALQQTISRLYRQAGIKMGSSHSGRRSFWLPACLRQPAMWRRFRPSWATSTSIQALSDRRSGYLAAGIRDCALGTSKGQHN